MRDQQSAWACHHKNGDGSVTRAELLLALRRDPNLAERLQLPARARQEGQTRAMFERVFAEIDTDGSGSLALGELFAFFERHKAAAATEQASGVSGPMSTQ